MKRAIPVCLVLVAAMLAVPVRAQEPSHPALEALGPEGSRIGRELTAFQGGAVQAPCARCPQSPDSFPGFTYGEGAELFRQSHPITEQGLQGWWQVTGYAYAPNRFDGRRGFMQRGFLAPGGQPSVLVFSRTRDMLAESPDAEVTVGSTGKDVGLWTGAHLLILPMEARRVTFNEGSACINFAPGVKLECRKRRTELMVCAVLAYWPANLPPVGYLALKFW